VKNFKNLIVIICFIAAGIVSGSAFASSTTVYIHPCQHDECEDSWLGDYCKDNPEGGTYCGFDAEDCKTLACGH
jgi:hypothetical protein